MSNRKTESVFNDVSSSIFMSRGCQVFIFIVLFTALLLNITELVFFCTVLIISRFLSYLWALFSLKKIYIKIRPETESLLYGQDLKIYLEADNRKILPVLLKSSLFIENLVFKEGGIRKTSGEKLLFWFQKTEFLFNLIPENRGIYFIHNPEIRGGDFPGFCFRKYKGTGGKMVTVYPQIHEIINISLRKKEYYGIKKGFNAVPERLLVNGIREYKSGSNIRNIHWKSTARHNALMEKVFDSAQKEKVLIILDVNNFKSNSCSFEKIIEAAASAAVKLNHSGVSAGFLTNGNIYGGRSGYIPVSGNHNQMMLILETLAGLMPGDGIDMTELFLKGRYLSNGISCLYFTSDSSKLSEIILYLRNVPLKCIAAEKNETDYENIIFIDDFYIKEGKSI